MMKRSDGLYEGLAMDIYNRVKQELLKQGVNLNLIFEDVDTYGSKLPNGRWTGVIGRLTNGGVSHILSICKLSESILASVVNHTYVEFKYRLTMVMGTIQEKKLKICCKILRTTC